jgi:hypothetical protein
MTTLAPSCATGTEALAAALRRAVSGAVHSPADPDVPALTAGFNVATLHRPELVVVARTATDVAGAVAVAAQHGRSVAVQATGHGAGSVGPGTILILTGGLTSLEVDPVARIARVGAGVRWQQVLDAAAPFGLAPLAGSAPAVGAVGYTLGGGLGPVARTFGFAADHVRELEVVTADGRLVRVDATTDPERFWALRGGGAAFGLVTSMVIDLFPVATLYAGGLWFAVEDAARVAHIWRGWAGALPDTMSTSIARLNLPPLPGLPEPIRGRAVLHVRVAFVGSARDGAALLASIRSAAPPPLFDTVGEMPYAALGAVHADPVDPLPVAERSALLTTLSVEAVDAFLAVTSPAHELPILVAELRLLGGALGRAPRVPDAVGGRDAAAAYTVIGVLAPPVAAAVPAALETALAALGPWSTGGCLMNFAGVPDDVSSERIRRAFPDATLDRLAALRRRTDPAGVFDPASRWALPASADAGAGR